MSNDPSEHVSSGEPGDPYVRVIRNTASRGERDAAERALSADASPVAFLYRTFDDMIAFFGAREDESELARAHEQYEQHRGRVFEDEELWENWSQAFLEWYALGKHGTDVIPIVEYLASLDAHSDGYARKRAALSAWLTSQRSLYEIRALSTGRVELLDILSGGWFAVAEQRAFAGVNVGDVAELRLVGFEGDVRFGRTFLFHPSGTREPILAHARRIRTAGGSRADIVDYCAGLRIRCVRYRHVSPRRVYEHAKGSPERLSRPGIPLPRTGVLLESAPNPASVSPPEQEPER